MTDSHPANGGAQTISPTDAHPPFPFVRFLYAIGFGMIAWFVFGIIVLVAVVQFIMIAIGGRVNEELRHFSVNLVQYLWELLAFITFVRDDQPFPLGPFPTRPTS